MTPQQRKFVEIQDAERLVDLEDERTALAEAGRLHWFHWSIVIVSAVLTFVAYWYIAEQNDQKTAAQFKRESAQIIELISERMRKYEDALWSGVATIKSHGGHISHEQWRSFADSLHIELKYPGINGIGVIEPVSREALSSYIAAQRITRPDFNVHPEHSGSVHLPIVYIEPERPNKKAVGLDMAHEMNRFTAAQSAQRSGEAQITGPIVLVQDESATSGFLFYVPYYSGVGAAGLNTVDARQNKFAGMVYAPFVVNRLLAGTLAKNRRHIGIKIVDAQEVIYDEYDSNGNTHDPNPMFQHQVKLDLYGRQWVVDMWSDLSFRQSSSSSQPMIVLIGGLTIDLLLLVLFILLSRANRRAVQFADGLTVSLRKQAAALTKSNADLESFAYVASHDLKTPLRGMNDLTNYLEEDLEDYLNTANVNPDVVRNIGRMKQQNERMESLVRGILEYSTVGRCSEVSSVDLHELITELRLGIGVSESQLRIQALPLKFMTYKLQFKQVLQNLVENAFKYHHDREQAQVILAYSEGASFFEFKVRDNGPGIAPEYHERVFETFQTLQSKDQIESTGIGLSIVKRTVEVLGGRIHVESSTGAGSTFIFTWPKTVAGTDETGVAA